MQGGGPVAASLTSSASSAARSPRRPGGDVISSLPVLCAGQSPSSLLLFLSQEVASSRCVHTAEVEKRGTQSLGGRGLGDPGSREHEGGRSLALGPPCGPQLPTLPPILVQSEIFLLSRTAKRAIC